ncbi:PREDICTED: complement C3-like [Acropora digitifera]|uniref:complement C3-like n=1 Tax=Acropora digitifera TaxID=70779 RepID=UPI00077A746E|nr:PREDICTED: complement C3-like [Acropora digitifera]
MLDILITLFAAVSVASTESAARIFITAPNVFHLGVEETISVITYNVNNPVNVTIVALEYPGKFRNLGEANGIFTSEEPGILKLKLDPDDFPVNEDDISTNRYVSLVAKTNNTDLAIDGEEVKVLVSFSDGIVLLQTDKPIYTPQHSLEYTRGIFNEVLSIVSVSFTLLGVDFEVKEYVLPKFSVKILAPKYVLPDAKYIRISVRASYTYGKGVEGSVHVKTSLVGKHRRAFSTGQRSQQLEGGKTDFVFRIDDIKAVPGLVWFPEGRRFQVEADVIEKASGKKESAIDNGIYFVRSPFKIEHQPTAEYFKPTLPFLVKVDVFYPDKKPASGIPVAISVKGTTASGKEFDIGKKTQSEQVNVNFEDSTNDQGRAAFVIDTPTNVNKMKIRVETNKRDIAEEHNTFVEFEVNAFSSPSRTFLYLRATRVVFHVHSQKAGTVVITNADVNSRGRTEFGCQQRQQRKKRSTVEDPSPCCKAGFRPARASCLIRAKYWYSQATESCKNEFLRCCFNATGEKDPAKTQVRSRKVHQSELTFVEEDISQGQTRKYFPETWIFTEDNVGDDGIFHLFTNLPHSITTWVIQAVGVSNHTGLGLARPLYIRAFQQFFVSLRVPYSVQRGEQISVIATVFNYGEFNTKVKIKLVESKEFCTYESTDKTSANLLVSVKSNDAVSVSFPIVPIKLGRLSIKVRAEALFDEESFINEVIARDEVLRSILVLPEGVERRTSYSFVLDPQGILRDEKTETANSTSPTSGIKHDRVVHNDMQIDSVLLAVPARAIPGSLSARLSLTGNLIGPAVSTLISGGLENLLRMPMGCGEQTMMFLAPNVYVLQYLSKTKQVTADIESRAYEMIQSGYQRALNYRRTDKSFSAFGESRPGSTWLTAFATRVFCAAGKFDGIEIDEALVCDSVRWILDNQRLDGAFPEVKDIIHKSMMGGTHGDVAMTAFVLVALLECGCNHQDRGQRIQNAVSFLETELNDIHKVNILSLTTYALALTGSTKSDLANRKLLRRQTNDKGNATRHWDAGDTALSVETTAYALLAQMALGRLKSAGPIVTWLSSQRDPQGGFVSTQIEVRHNIPAPKNETCHFDVSIKVREEIRENVVDNIPVFRAGHMMQNDADDDEDDNSDDHFEERGRKRRKCRKNPQRKKCRKRKTNNKKHLKPKMEAKVPDALQLQVCARYLKPNGTGMTIMDIGVFSGFIPDEDSLIELMENVKPTVDRFEISDRSVILYVSQISSDIEFCAKFTINRIFHVGTVQPVPVKIYDYYKPDDSCTEFYSPKPSSALLAGVCEEGHCRCSQDDCTPCIDRSFNPDELVEKICHESVDFAVVGELVLIDEVDFRKQSWITFEIKLNQILKKGNTDLRKGDFVEFKRRSGCACPELTERKEFLIMGREEGSFFIFDEKSIVIPWVKKRKSSNSDIRARIGIDFRCSI